MELGYALMAIAQDYESEAQAARAHGITPSMWTRLKHGKQIPTIQTLNKLGLVMNYELDPLVRSWSREALAYASDHQGPRPSLTLVGGSYGTDENRPRPIRLAPLGADS
jgi:transcriptional regulator with XRE-family HTH domain